MKNLSYGWRILNFKNSISILLLVIISITPLIITPFTFALDFFYLPKIIFIYFLISIIFYLWFFYERDKFPKLSKVNLSYKIIFFYFIFLLLSTIFSPYIHQALWGNVLREEGFFALSAYLLLFLFAKRYFCFQDSYFKWIILSASLVASYGILQHFNIDFIPRDIFRMDWVGVSFSTIGNPNFLGTYLVLMLPLSLFQYCNSKKYVYLLTSCIIFLCLLMTMTRGAWLGCLFSLLFIFIILLKSKIFINQLLKFSIAFFLIILLFNFVENFNLLARFATIFTDFNSIINQNNSYEKSGSYRIIIWQHTLDLIKIKPWLGYGPDTFGKALSEFYNNDIAGLIKNKIYFDKAHNEYLQIAVSSGILALFLYLSFILIIIKKSYERLNSNPKVIFVMASVIGYLVQAFFNISVVSVAYIYWILLGVLFQFSYTPNKN